MKEYYVIDYSSASGSMHLTELSKAFPKNAVCWIGEPGECGHSFCAFTEEEFAENAVKLVELFRGDSAKVFRAKAKSKRSIDFREVSDMPCDYGVLVSASSAGKLAACSTEKKFAYSGYARMDDKLRAGGTYVPREYEVEAIMFDGTNSDEIEDFLGWQTREQIADSGLVELVYQPVYTDSDMEAAMGSVMAGDWLVRGSDGTVRTVSDAEFNELYMAKLR